MATIVRETYRNNIHYFIVLAGRQPLSIYADNGDNTWNPAVDRYLGPSSREPEFKNSSEFVLIQSSTFIKQQIKPKDVVQHTLNALKVAIQMTAENGDVMQVGSGKKSVFAAEFDVILKKTKKYFEKNIKRYPDLVFIFGAENEAEACRSAIAALTKKKGNQAVIDQVQRRLEQLDIRERLKHDDKPMVR